MIRMSVVIAEIKQRVNAKAAKMKRYDDRGRLLSYMDVTAGFSLNFASIFYVFILFKKNVTCVEFISQEKLPCP